MVSRDESYHPFLEKDDSDRGDPCRGTNYGTNEVLGGASESGQEANHTDIKVEKTSFQSVSEIIIESAHSLKDVVSGRGIIDTGDGEGNNVLQALRTRISQSVNSMKETVVNGTHEKLLTDPDELGEASILVHTVLD